MLNAVLVLMMVTSALGPVLTERFAPVCLVTRSQGQSVFCRRRIPSKVGGNYCGSQKRKSAWNETVRQYNSRWQVVFHGRGN